MVVRADGGRREVELDRPVHHRAVAQGGGLCMQIALGPPTAVPTGVSSYDHHQVAFLVPRADPEDDRVTWDAPPCTSPGCGTPDGTWPDLGVRITFRHPYFPGGVLTRRIRLFDELGRASIPDIPASS